MTNNQITSIIIALIGSRYVAPGKDNEKTAKEIVKIYNILKEKTCDEDDDREDIMPGMPGMMPPGMPGMPGMPGPPFPGQMP